MYVQPEFRKKITTKLVSVKFLQKQWLHLGSFHHLCIHIPISIAIHWLTSTLQFQKNKKKPANVNAKLSLQYNKCWQKLAWWLLPVLFWLSSLLRLLLMRIRSSTTACQIHQRFTSALQNSCCCCCCIFFLPFDCFHFTYSTASNALASSAGSLITGAKRLLHDFLLLLLLSQKYVQLSLFAAHFST